MEEQGPRTPELGVSLIDANVVKIFDQLRGTQNLYVKLTSSHGDSDEQEVARSALCHKADLHPVWNERLAVRRDGATTLRLGVFADHYFRKDCFCGEATLDPSLLILEIQRGMHGNGNPCEMQLWKKGMPVGRLRAEFDFGAGGSDAQSALPAGPELRALLGRPTELDATLRAWYRPVAQAEGDARVIQLDHVSQIVELLAARMEAAPLTKADIDELFWQFETSGDARLHEDEAVRLVQHTLRRYRARPPKHQDCSAKYKIQREIGRGHHGVVSLATTRDTSHSVIVKMYGQVSWNERKEKLAMDFEILTSISHPRIARVVDIFQDWGNVYVVQEPHFDGDLTNALEKAQGAGVRVDEQWLACLVGQVLDGLSFLHASGVVHCNVKEQSVLLAGKTDWHRPQVVVSNFGLAKVCCKSARTCGTPGYMPPEVWEHGLWTPRGDVFSLGAMMFVLWTGRPPFRPPGGGGSAQEVARRTREEEPQMESGSAALQGLVRSMMRKGLSGRPVAARAAQDAWSAPRPR